MHEVYLRNNFKATGFLTFLKLSKQQDLCVCCVINGRATTFFQAGNPFPVVCRKLATSWKMKTTKILNYSLLTGGISSLTVPL